MTAPWPLLADLDALLSREGWQEDEDAVAVIEHAIADDTYIGKNSEWAAIVRGPVSTLRTIFWPPFLRSRDAAAMLRDAVMAHDTALWLEHLTNRINGEVRQVYRYPVLGISCANAVEAAADTRAALESGWKIGLWPMRAGDGGRR